MPRKGPEALIQKQITDYLTYRNFFWWRNNTGAMASPSNDGHKRRFIRFGKKGSPDIFVLFLRVLFGIEVKAEKGSQTDSQKQYEIDFKEAGGVYVLAKGKNALHSVLEALDVK